MLRRNLSALDIVSDGPSFSFNDNVAREFCCASIDDTEGPVVPTDKAQPTVAVQLLREAGFKSMHRRPTGRRW